MNTNEWVDNKADEILNIFFKRGAFVSNLDFEDIKTALLEAEEMGRNKAVYEIEQYIIKMSGTGVLLDGLAEALTKARSNV